MSDRIAETLRKASWREPPASPQPSALPPIFREQSATQKRYDQLVALWHEETRLTSSLSELLMHPAYAQIIGMGKDALPLILRSLEREADHWGWALTAITGENPVPDEAEGDIVATAAAWLQWARDQGIRW